MQFFAGLLQGTLHCHCSARLAEHQSATPGTSSLLETAEKGKGPVRLLLVVFDPLDTPTVFPFAIPLFIL